jgi:hypothetical protein
MAWSGAPTASASGCHSRAGPPILLVLTLWVSMTAAVGLGSGRSFAIMHSQTMTQGLIYVNLRLKILAGFIRYDLANGRSFAPVTG